MPGLLVPLAILVAMLHPQPALGQKFYRIGALVAADQFLPAIEGFKGKMAEIGYVEGKNVRYEIHNARGDAGTLKQLARKLVQDRPDLIVTSSTTATAAVARTTEGTSIPVVFLSAGNPLKFVKSYSSSGNNLTGITTSSIDLTEKRMELLKELAPGLKKLICLHNPKGENYEANLKATREAAKKLGLQLVEVNVSSSEEIIRRASEIFNRRVGDAVFHPPDAIINAAIMAITSDINRERLPSIVANIGNVKAGALATYSADYFALGQQGAVLVDKVLKGARPRDLPIEQPFKLKLVLNLKTAKAIGLRIPREILLRADEVFE